MNTCTISTEMHRIAGYGNPSFVGMFCVTTAGTDSQGYQSGFRLTVSNREFPEKFTRETLGEMIRTLKAALDVTESNGPKPP